jgi:hypothetical protein
VRTATSPATSTSQPALRKPSQSKPQTRCVDPRGMQVSKPVIYLYPARATEISVRLIADGALTHSEPLVDSAGQWRVLASPSGRLVSLDSGGSYPYLFWEADLRNDIDMSTGFVVSGGETRSFLRTKLASLGLSDSEAAAFIDYWAPRMDANEFNLVHFEGPAYERVARLDVTPKPDTSIRVFMVFRPLDQPACVTPQVLPRPARRRGFVLVEWGGTELPDR